MTSQVLCQSCGKVVQGEADCFIDKKQIYYYHVGCPMEIPE